MKLPPRQYVAPAPSPAPTCDCLSGGAIAGIVIGSIAGVFLMWWLIKFAFLSTRSDGLHNSYTTTTTYEPRRSSRSSGSRSRRGSYYVSPPPTSVSAKRSRRYRDYDDYVERPSKVYIN